LQIQKPGTTTPVDMGQQTFDGLDRLKTVTNGGRQWRYSYSDSDQCISQKPSQVYSPDGFHLTYKYNVYLGEVITQIDASNSSKKYYYSSIGRLSAASETGGLVTTYAYDSLGRVNEKTHIRAAKFLLEETKWSVLGRRLSQTDVDGTVTKFTYNKNDGSLNSVSGTDVQADFSYNNGHISGWSVLNSSDAFTLNATITRDAFLRETARTYTSTKMPKALTVGQAFDPLLGLVSSRSIQEAGSSVATQKYSYEYDNRNRLSNWKSTGVNHPQDPLGFPLTDQVFTYDAFSNITQAQNTYADGSTKQFTYGFSATDNAQLLSVHCSDSSVADIALEYDSCGRMVKDEAGRKLTYDRFGRLYSVQDATNTLTYAYDAFDKLSSQTLSDGKQTNFYYRDNALSYAIDTNNGTQTINRWVRANGEYLAHQTPQGISAAITTAMGSTLAQLDKTGVSALRAYTAYGYLHADPDPTADLDFNGQIRDPITGHYHLGNGYRAFNPILMRFNAPDSLSPFGQGGVNPYAYCQGDPINFADPSGHFKMNWVLAGAMLMTLAVVVVPGAGAIADTAEMGIAAYRVATEGAEATEAAAVLAEKCTVANIASTGVKLVAVAATATQIGTGIASMCDYQAPKTVIIPTKNGSITKTVDDNSKSENLEAWSIGAGAVAWGATMLAETVNKGINKIAERFNRTESTSGNTGEQVENEISSTARNRSVSTQTPGSFSLHSEARSPSSANLDTLIPMPPDRTPDLPPARETVRPPLRAPSGQMSNVLGMPFLGNDD
ncbi:RHS repeat-associated core domain-containing protein, partial [Brucella sp. TWI432]